MVTTLQCLQFIYKVVHSDDDLSDLRAEGRQILKDAGHTQAAEDEEEL